jgi:hypothetical protein
MMEDVTKITYTAGITEIAVEMKGSQLDYDEFMELIESLIGATSYSKSEIESYVLAWANDINATKNN